MCFSPSSGERRHEARERAARRNEKQKDAAREKKHDAADFNAAADEETDDDVDDADGGKTRRSKSLKKEVQKWMKKTLIIYGKLTDYVWRILELHIFKVKTKIV